MLVPGDLTSLSARAAVAALRGSAEGKSKAASAVRPNVVVLETEQDPGKAPEETSAVYRDRAAEARQLGRSARAMAWSIRS